MGLRSGAGAGRAGAQPRRDLCVLARDWRDRRAHGLVGVGGTRLQTPLKRERIWSSRPNRFLP